MFNKVDFKPIEEVAQAVFMQPQTLKNILEDSWQVVRLLETSEGLLCRESDVRCLLKGVEAKSLTISYKHNGANDE